VAHFPHFNAKENNPFSASTGRKTATLNYFLFL